MSLLFMSDLPNTPPADETSKDQAIDQAPKNEPTDKELNFEALRKGKEQSDKKLKELQDEIKSRNEAELLAQGNLQALLDLKTKEANEYRTQSEAIQFESKLKDEIAKSGVNPKYLKYLQGEVKEAVQVSDTGEITGLAEKISQVKTEFPEWFAPTTITAGFGSGLATGGAKPLSIEAIGNLTPAQYAAQRDAVKQSF